MTKQLNYYYDNAKKCAEDFAKENNGYVSSSMVTLDDRSLLNASEGDDVPSDFCFSGEVCAFEVIDNDTYETLGYFAYWE